MAQSPLSHQLKYQQPHHFASVKIKDYSPNPNKGIKGELPVPKIDRLVDGSQAISSIQFNDQKLKAFVAAEQQEDSFAFTDHGESRDQNQDQY